MSQELRPPRSVELLSDEQQRRISPDDGVYLSNDGHVWEVPKRSFQPAIMVKRNRALSLLGMIRRCITGKRLCFSKLAWHAAYDTCLPTMYSSFKICEKAAGPMMRTWIPSLQKINGHTGLYMPLPGMIVGVLDLRSCFGKISKSHYQHLSQSSLSILH